MKKNKFLKIFSLLCVILFLLFLCFLFKFKNDKNKIIYNIKISYGYELSDNNINKIVLSKDNEINKCIISEKDDPRYYDIYYKKSNNKITFYTKIKDIYKPMQKILK